jgi:hypothetical protein
MMPRLLVQLLQQTAARGRLQPVFEILHAAPVGFQHRQKDVRCRSGDLALVWGDFYSDCTLPNGSRVEYSEDDGDEDEAGGKTKVIAVIREKRKSHATQYRQGQITDEVSSPAKFFFSCSAIWEAITAQNGNHYQLIAFNSEGSEVNGDYKLSS